MGRTYLFECPRCSYQARVAGGPDQGADLVIHTCVCVDCRRLFDAVVRARVRAAEAERLTGIFRNTTGSRVSKRGPSRRRPPAFETMLGRLPFRADEPQRWVEFAFGCTVSKYHQVRPWKTPGRCPQCGTYLEQKALPFRLWG